MLLKIQNISNSNNQCSISGNVTFIIIRCAGTSVDTIPQTNFNFTPCSAAKPYSVTDELKRGIIPSQAMMCHHQSSNVITRDGMIPPSQAVS